MVAHFFAVMRHLIPDAPFRATPNSHPRGRDLFTRRRGRERGNPRRDFDADAVQTRVDLVMVDPTPYLSMHTIYL